MRRTERRTERHTENRSYVGVAHMCLLQLQLAELAAVAEVVLLADSFAGAVAAYTNDRLVALNRNISTPLTEPEMEDTAYCAYHGSLCSSLDVVRSMPTNYPTSWAYWCKTHLGQHLTHLSTPLRDRECGSARS